MQSIQIRNDDLTAEVSSLGAELISLRFEGRDYLWDGDPAYWKGRAPLLFPIVGRVPEDAIHVGGKSYPMRQHGLARISAFELVMHDATSCVFRLDASDATRSIYPFEFSLTVRYALAAAGLTIEATVGNEGDVPMPASFGFHPALRWPLPGGGAKEAHELVFEQAEDAPVRRLTDGLLRADADPSPIVGRRLALSERLFADDVIILDRIRSRSVEYRAPNGPAIKVAFQTMPHLGLWSKPGAGFLCIEPWQGHAAPAAFRGELAAKPGVVEVRPGSVTRFAISLEICR